MEISKQNIINTEGNKNITIQDVTSKTININQISEIENVFEKANDDFLKKLLAQIDERYKEFEKVNKNIDKTIAMLRKQMIQRNITIDGSKNFVTGTISDVKGNVYIGDIIYNTLPYEKKEKIDQQIYLKCNRENIENDLENLFDNNNMGKKTQIIFIPGLLNDKIPLAVKKLTFLILEQLGNPIIHFKLKDWTEYNNNKNSLKRNVFKTVQSYMINKRIKSKIELKFDNATTITQQPVIKKHTLIFEIDVDINSWNKTTLKNIKWYVNEFWNIELSENSKPIFLFINIVNGKEKLIKQSEQQKIITDIEKLFVNSNNIKIFSQLNKINRGHVEQFLEKCNIHDAKNFVKSGETHTLHYILPQLAEILYRRDIKADFEALTKI